MGIGTWILAGIVASLLTRYVALGRPARLLPELAAAVMGAAVFGVVATALDFGGWNEVDWRAAVFAFLGALLVTGALRTLSARRAVARSRQRPAA